MLDESSSKRHHHHCDTVWEMDVKILTCIKNVKFRDHMIDHQIASKIHTNEKCCK